MVVADGRVAADNLALVFSTRQSLVALRRAKKRPGWGKFLTGSKYCFIPHYCVVVVVVVVWL